MTGSDWERKLATILHDQGYAVMRAPSSGGGTAREMPDLLYGRSGRSVAVELKTGRDTTLYVDKAEVDALNRFCEAFGAEPRLGFRHTRQATTRNYYLVHPDDARQTESGNFGLPLDDIEDRASEVIEP